MALCDHCRASLANPDPPPAPWFDAARHAIAGQAVQPLPWAMLECLWRRRGHYVSKDSLMVLLYESKLGDEPFDHVLSIHASKLRKAMRSTPWTIDGRRKVGFGIVAHGSPAALGVTAVSLLPTSRERIAR